MTVWSEIGGKTTVWSEIGKVVGGPRHNKTTITYPLRGSSTSNEGWSSSEYSTRRDLPLSRDT